MVLVVFVSVENNPPDLKSLRVRAFEDLSQTAGPGTAAVGGFLQNQNTSHILGPSVEWQQHTSCQGQS